MSSAPTEDKRTEIALSDPQHDFLTSWHKHTGFVAGFGSGKSYIGTLKTLLRIILFGIPKVAYYLPTYGDIRDIAFDGFPMVCESLGYKYKLNKSDKEFFVYNADGSVMGVVMFRNLSEPESIVGYQVGYSLIDETDILKQETMDKAFKKILGRNRLITPVTDESILQEYADTGIEPDGTYYHEKKDALCWLNCIDVAGTPEGFKWFYKRFILEATDKDLLIKASTYSNLENLSSDFIDTLREQYTPELFNAYVNGEFVNLTSGTLYEHFNRSVNHDTVDLDSFEVSDIILIGQDFNVGGNVSILAVEIDNDIYIFGEREELNTFDTGDMIAETFADFEGEIYPDATGVKGSSNSTTTDIEILEAKCHFDIVADKVNPRVKDRVNSVNNAFYHKRLWIDTDKCPKLTSALEQQAYTDKGEPEKFNTAGSIDDYNDPLGYLVHKKLPLVKQRYYFGKQ